MVMLNYLRRRQIRQHVTSWESGPGPANEQNPVAWISVYAACSKERRHGAQHVRGGATPTEPIVERRDHLVELARKARDDQTRRLAREKPGQLLYVGSSEAEHPPCITSGD